MITDEELLKIYEKAHFEFCYDGYEGPIDWPRHAVIQRVRPVPAPVAERPWEREGWCDAKGRCWLFDRGRPLIEEPSWTMVHKSELEEIFEIEKEGFKELLCIFRAMCLPHWALPLPGGDHFPGAGNMVEQEVQ